MIGARCADLIAEAVVSMEFKASAEDISRMSLILQSGQKLP
jgi:dihydrolipoamide dehydrogenase